MLNTIVPKSDNTTKSPPEGFLDATFRSSQANRDMRMNASVINTSDIGFVRAALVVSGDVKKK